MERSVAATAILAVKCEAAVESAAWLMDCALPLHSMSPNPPLPAAVPSHKRQDMLCSQGKLQYIDCVACSRTSLDLLWRTGMKKAHHMKGKERPPTASWRASIGHAAEGHSAEHWARAHQASVAVMQAHQALLQLAVMQAPPMFWPSAWQTMRTSVLLKVSPPSPQRRSYSKSTSLSSPGPT